MNRWTACAAMALLVASSAAAKAATPVPKPNPGRIAPTDPQAVIRHMMDDEPLGPTVNAYAAPSAPTRSIAPDLNGDVALYLVGKLSDRSGPIGDGLMWRVYRDAPDKDGQLPLVEKADGGDLELRLPPGRYIVHASYGRATASRALDLTRRVTSETLVLDAGGLRLAAVLDESNQPLAENTAFELYRKDGDDRLLLGNIRAGAIARLPAGIYHVVSRYGGVNAVRSADVTVEAGKLTSVSLRHTAGTVRLKLVRNTGGEALANTAWTVYAEDGRPVFERVGAHANLTLAAGTYEVVANHSNAEFRRSFTVRSGDQADVVVLARRL